MMSKVAVLCALFAVSQGSITATRKVTSIIAGGSGSLNLKTGCTATDEYGCSAFALNWGTNYTVEVKAQLPEAIGEGATLEVDAKIDGLLPLKFTCAVCGAVCEFTIPLIGKKVSLTMPACPLAPAGPYNATAVLPLPAKDPVALDVSVSGTGEVKDKAGKVLLAVSVDGKMSP
eukprot:Rhum_TRINITY_DN14694_c0_g1::Rhum_TRINITY_DN14694_c0_g1_i1::g.108854::m.108854